MSHNLFCPEMEQSTKKNEVKEQAVEQVVQ
jgi:hypothetical protein